MVMSGRTALDAAQTIISEARAAERPRLHRIAEAMKPDHRTVLVPNGSPPTLDALAAKARTNLLPLVVKTFSQVMRVDGYQSPDRAGNAAVWEHWQRNRMDARQTGIHRAALIYGTSYASVLPDPDSGRPVIKGFSPRLLTAVYQDPETDEWPVMTLDVNGSLVRLIDEEAEYFFGDEGDPRSGMVPPRYDVAAPGMVGTYRMGGLWAPQLTFIEARPHGLGVCPVVRYRDRMLLDGEEQLGIVEPLLAVQERIDETVYGLLVAQFFAAFKQRYVIGWVPKSEEEELKAHASSFWTFEDTDVTVGQFAETDLTRYLEAREAGFRDLAAMGQVPPHGLGVANISNISAEALAAWEAGKDREGEEITTSMGEGHEQLFRLLSLSVGDSGGWDDYDAQVRWKNATARSLAQTADALGKMAQMLGVPAQGLWRMIPGVTQQDIEEWKDLAEQEDALDVLLGQVTRGRAASNGASPNGQAEPGAAVADRG